MEYKIVGIALLLVLSTTAVVIADDVNVYSDTLNVSMYGGCTRTVNINVTWTGTETASAKLSTVIEPDGEGINITYSENDIQLEHNVPYTVQMSISTVPNIMPQVYTIYFQAAVEVDVPDGHKKVVNEPSGGKTDTVNETEEVDTDPVNETESKPNITEEPSIPDIIMVIEPHSLLIPIVFAVLIILASSVYIVYRKRKKNKEKKEKTK